MAANFPDSPSLNATFTENGLTFVWNGSAWKLNSSSGTKGETGQKGEVGVGDKGDKGDKGQKGEVAQKGQKGEIGPQGGSGSPGDKGQKGEAGVDGNDGTGIKGEPGVGVKGQKGEVGDKGAQGAGGTGGTDGDKGQKGEVGADNSTKGQKGEQGAGGTGGTDGTDGDKGQKGEQGADNSTKGQKGEAGTPAAGTNGVVKEVKIATSGGASGWSNNTNVVSVTVNVGSGEKVLLQGTSEFVGIDASGDEDAGTGIIRLRRGSSNLVNIQCGHERACAAMQYVDTGQSGNVTYHLYMQKSGYESYNSFRLGPTSIVATRYT